MKEEQIIIGGQAVIEGVMMRAPHSYAVAVRRSDGTIVTKGELIDSVAARNPMLKLPLFRGAFVLIQSMVLGIKALNFSAGVAYDEAQQGVAYDEAQQGAGKDQAAGHEPASPKAPFVLPKNEDPSAASSAAITMAQVQGSAKMPGAAAAGSIVLALGVNILLFILLPLLITNVLFVYLGNGSIHGHSENSAWWAQSIAWIRAALKPIRPTVAFNLVDGLIRMSFFLVMIWSMSRLKDIRRVFEYHGAEHKVVYVWEAGEALTVENARTKPRQHPRCGTSFLMLVMLVAIVTFSVVRFDSLVANFATRILLIPFIAGASYEIIRASARSKGQAILSVITKPGLWLQNITTKEPDDAQLEVSITSLKTALALEPGQAVPVVL
jgi:uncharacterized protein YqhQ